jgi:hypothetical protein
MKHRLLTMSVIFVLVASLGACKGESAIAFWKISSYSEAKEARKNHKPLSPEQLEKVYGECPKPNGVFKNDADAKNAYRLENFFSVEGFEIPATNYLGGREDDEPLHVGSNPIDLLGGEKNGVRQRYHHRRSPQERFTLELRPLGLGRFHIGVKSSNGLSGESDRGWIKSLGGKWHCESGVLKGFWKEYDKTVLGWELFVDEKSGDIVVHSPGRTLKLRSGMQQTPERYYRFKRIGE